MTSEALLHRAIAREQQQAFAIEIEPADWVDIRHGNVIGEGAARAFL
jgi:hypothetical protein